MHANLVLIGFDAAGLPVYSMRGGAPEGENEGGEGDGEGSEDADDDAAEDEADKYAPPSEAEWRRTQAALKKANGEAATRRKWLEEHGVDPRSGKRFDADDEDDEEVTPKSKAKKKSAEDDDDDTSQQVTAAELQRLEKLRRTEGKKAAAREARLSAALVKKAATVALRDAGWNGKGAPLIERMIDLGEVEVDDDGNVVGLDEQVAEVKSEMPDWFKKARATVRRTETNGSGGAREVDGADQRTTRTVEKPKTWLDHLSDQIDGQE